MNTNKKKIFFIMSTDDYSGAEAVNFCIIDNLKEQYDFYWVSRKGKINEFLKEKNIKWIEIKKMNICEIKRIAKIYKPDVLHATDYKASVICALANTGVFLIDHLHNNSPWLSKLSINSLAFLYSGLRANKILTVSESIEKEYIFSKYINKKIKCIGNPLSREKILCNVEKSDFAKKYDICCVARITEQKNPFKFLSIIEKVKKQNKDISVIWVGDGNLKEQVVLESKKLGLTENKTYVGFKKNPYKYMASSKIFLLTSDWEGFGLVAFEAITLGLPSVVSKVGGLVNIITEKCGKLCSEEIEYVEEINKLLTDKDYYIEKCKNSIDRAMRIENSEEYCLNISKIYEEE